MVNPVRRHPEDRAALKGKRGAERQKILDPFVGFISTVSQQPVIAHANSQAAAKPP